MRSRLPALVSSPQLTRTRDSVASWRSRAESWWRDLDASDRRRLGALTVALGAVTATFILQSLLDISSNEPQLWLFLAAVAISAATGSIEAAAVAVLASVLLGRLVGDAPLNASWPFVLEAGVIAFVVLRLAYAVRRERRKLDAADALLLELKASERRGRLVDAAFTHLDSAASDTVIVTLDRHRRIVDWRAGAARLYGRAAADVLTTSPAALFEDGSEETIEHLIAEARNGAARVARRHVRADGSVFPAEVHIRPLSRGGIDGFTMVVRDLTQEHAHEAAAASTATAYAQLQAEADIANEQLSTLRYIADPALNALTGDEFVAMLLDRLRSAIGADGIAVVYLNRFRRYVVCASTGLHSQRGVQRSLVELRRPDSTRTLMIHNDPGGVAELSAAGWPEGVSSLIAVPVVRGGSIKAVLEVVNRPGRRATEWEIALVEVVAARVAGYIQEEAYADSGAVA